MGLTKPSQVAFGSTRSLGSWRFATGPRRLLPDRGETVLEFAKEVDIGAVAYRVEERRNVGRSKEVEEEHPRSRDRRLRHVDSESAWSYSRRRSRPIAPRRRAPLRAQPYGVGRCAGRPGRLHDRRLLSAAVGRPILSPAKGGGGGREGDGMEKRNLGWLGLLGLLGLLGIPLDNFGLFGFFGFFGFFGLLGRRD